MTSGAHLQTVVVDTSALVSLGVPRSDADYDTDTAPDPLQYLLTSCDVSVPPAVVSELQDLMQYRDIHGAAATNVLAARDHYTVEDPYERDETPDSLVGVFDRVVVASGEDVSRCGAVDVPILHEVLKFRDDCWRHRDVARSK